MVSVEEDPEEEEEGREGGKEEMGRPSSAFLLTKLLWASVCCHPWCSLYSTSIVSLLSLPCLVLPLLFTGVSTAHPVETALPFVGDM